MTGVAGGTFTINMIDVADDGAIYVGNLSTSATSPILKFIVGPMRQPLQPSPLMDSVDCLAPEIPLPCGDQALERRSSPAAVGATGFALLTYW